jgi:FixJ family two-component response regulator
MDGHLAQSNLSDHEPGAGGGVDDGAEDVRGGSDVLQKPFEPAVLLETMHRAVETSRQLHLQRQQQQALRQRVANLTGRELELLKLLASGKPNKLIARELGISIKTVANHRASLMAKTGALNAADLGRLSMAAGILEVA